MHGVTIANILSSDQSRRTSLDRLSHIHYNANHISMAVNGALPDSYQYRGVEK
ncbi:MAG: hypothetical protein ACOYUK_04765 [Patescibacteria group bacterium]